jgi:hypothetical protein
VGVTVAIKLESISIPPRPLTRLSLQARNVLIDSLYRAKVSDFGFARSVVRSDSSDGQDNQVPVSALMRYTHGTV